MSSSYRSSRLGLSHWDPYAVRRGGCLELYRVPTVRESQGILSESRKVREYREGHGKVREF